MNGLAYTGCGVTGSHIGFNKYLTKVIAQKYGVPVVPYACLQGATDVPASLGTDLIVKINRGGSSIGVYPCTRDSLAAAVEEAFKQDSTVLVEKRLTVREVSVGVLHGELSNITEIVKEEPLRSYDAKYVGATAYDTNPPLSPEVREKILAYSRIIWTYCDLRGYARIDFFLTEDGSLYFNEVNTHPGLAKGSLFTKMWAGQSYLQLLIGVARSPV